MATVTYIKEAKQHISAMRAVMQYCQREDKTIDPQTGQRFVSGVNCNGANAFTEFVATKTAYYKLDGINFYQYVQSFSPRENITYQQAHAIGLEFAAKAWPGHEVQVTTHCDAQHIHTHFIVNSVSFETGMKLRQTPNKRQVPMLGFVKEAFLMERKYQQQVGLVCQVTIDGYTDFIFLNRDGGTFYQGSLNKTIRRIIRDCNDAVLQKGEENPVLLPHFSCHSLRHTFTTRMCEAGVNIKVMQDTLGHADISTTLNIYADVTRELKKDAFDGLDAYFKGEKKDGVPPQKQEEKKAKTGKRRAQTGITSQPK